MSVINKFREAIGWGKRIDSNRVTKKGSQQSVDTKSYMMNILATYEQPEGDLELYHAMATNVPIIHGAINAYMRLTNTTLNIVCSKDETRNLVYDIIERIELDEVINKALYQYNTYGFVGVEVVLDSTYTDIVKLKVIDSRTLRVKKDPWGNIIEYRQIIGIPTGDAQQSNSAPGTIILNPDTIMYFQRQADDDSAYGVSLLRCLPFITSTMLSIQTAIGKIYRRYGAPKYHVTYNPSTPIPDNIMEDRMEQIKNDFEDFDTESDFFSNGDVQVDVIGAGTSAIQFTAELQHIMEQLMSGLGLPANVLGYNYGSTETHAKEQNIILMGNIENTQRTFKRVIENTLMTMIAQIYDLEEVPQIEFDKTEIRDELLYQTAENYKVVNVITKRDGGIISQDEAAVELGYRKAHSQEYFQGLVSPNASTGRGTKNE